MKSECEVRQDERRKAIFALETVANGVQKLLQVSVDTIKGAPLPLGADVSPSPKVSTQATPEWLETENARAFANLQNDMRLAHAEIDRLTKDRDEWKEATENGLAVIRRLRNELTFPLCASCRIGPNALAGKQPAADPEPTCLSPWTLEMAMAWLKHHPEWYLHGYYRAGIGNRGWRCECGSYCMLGATPEEAVQMAANLTNPGKNE